MIFKTKIYHPNVNESGHTCFDGDDILKDTWSPAITIAKVLEAFRRMIEIPSPDDPVMPEIAREYKLNKEMFDCKAR